MKIITVSGSYSGVGKTTVAAALLRSLPNWSALKVTTTPEGNCPRERSCKICSGLSKDFCIITNDKIISQEGKDTLRLKNAGARQIIWLIARPDGLKEGLQKALSLFNEAKGLIIEGTSILRYLDPDLAIFVRRRRGDEIKATAQEVMHKMDLVLTNKSPSL